MSFITPFKMQNENVKRRNTEHKSENPNIKPKIQYT